MSVRRLVLLQLALLVGLGSVYLLPARAYTQPIGVTMDLPDFIGNWFGTPQKVTQGELEELAADTEFARRVYTNGLGDQIWVSIVLAGEDPDNSIHRPERCLPAQGWTLLDSKTVTLTSPSLSNGQLKVTRLRSEQKIEDRQGNFHVRYNLNYYWFVGYNKVTPSHIERALTDIRDRVVRGYNQRWAYVTVAADITESKTRYRRSETATDELIHTLIVQ